MRYAALVMIAAAVAEAQPGGRQMHQQMTYDERSRRVLMFGGSGNDGVLGGLWTFDGKAWELISSDGPGPRESGVMVYDSRRKRTVLFGGRDRQQKQLGETWEWDGARWHSMGSDGPPLRLHAAAAFDPKRGVIVVFGPVFPPGGMVRPLPAETWLWDGRKWGRVKASGPADCVPLGMAYDRSSGSILLLTTRFPPASSQAPWGVTEAWRWTGEQWTPSAVQPPQVAALDGNLAGFGNGLVLVGGDGVTWDWDGRRWSGAGRSGPPRRSAHVVAYDRGRKRVVLFGGTRNEGGTRTRLGDTWEWNGRAWIEVR